MKNVILKTNRSGYSVDQIYSTLTVGELIGILMDYDENEKVYFSNDDGYTYGGLSWDSVDEEEEESDEEESEEE